MTDNLSTVLATKGDEGDDRYTGGMVDAIIKLGGMIGALTIIGAFLWKWKAIGRWIQGRYWLRTLRAEDNAYWKVNQQGKRVDGPFCMGCLDNASKKIRLAKRCGDHHQCPVCNQSFSLTKGGPKHIYRPFDGAE